MLKKIPLRLRLTIISVLLLTLCCFGLTFILNISANRMADAIEAIPLSPAQSVNFKDSPTDAKALTLLMPIEVSETSQNARFTFLQNSIVYMTLVVMLGGALTYYLSGSALKPLQELSQQMKNITVHNLSENLSVPESADEIADLTRSFNQMSSKLDAAFAMQKRFSQSAAHELRTPLTVLKTKVDVFKKKAQHSTEEYDNLLSVITTHTNRLSDLVNDLLNLTNMDTVDYNEPVELKSMLNEVTEELSQLAQEKNIAIAVEGTRKMIQGNRSLLHRAFYNLIENAIKYNCEGGSVNIHLMAQQEQSIITITDTGIGIPATLHEIIFEPFYRVDESRSRQIAGAGLGLSTVKTIIEKHHGEINVGNNSTVGTVFTVRL